MNERRKFIKGFGLFGAVLAGAASAKLVIEEKKKPIEDISDLAPPDTAYMLQIKGSYPYKKPEPEPMNNGMLFIPSNTPTTHSVSMTVGKDNRLWIKVDDQWKRVSVE